MGKLAERLSDPARTGVYRIESTSAVEEAAALNCYRLVHVAVNGSAQPVLDAATDGERVIVVSGFEHLAQARPQELRALLSALESVASGWRARGLRAFVAFLDPACALPALAPLYNWNKARTVPQASGAMLPNCSARSASARSSTK